jgi:hypothetical protein
VGQGWGVCAQVVEPQPCKRKALNSTPVLQNCKTTKLKKKKKLNREQSSGLESRASDICLVLFSWAGSWTNHLVPKSLPHAITQLISCPADTVSGSCRLTWPVFRNNRRVGVLLTRMGGGCNCQTSVMPNCCAQTITTYFQVPEMFVCTHRPKRPRKAEFYSVTAQIWAGIQILRQLYHMSETFTHFPTPPPPRAAHPLLIPAPLCLRDFSVFSTPSACLHELSFWEW